MYESDSLHFLAEEATTFEKTINEVLDELKLEFFTAKVHPDACERFSTKLKPQHTDKSSLNYIELETRDNFLRRISAVEPQIETVTQDEVVLANNQAHELELEFSELDKEINSLTQELTDISKDTLDKYLSFSEKLGLAKLEIDEALEMERELRDLSNGAQVSQPHSELVSTILDLGILIDSGEGIADFKNMVSNEATQLTRDSERLSATLESTNKDLARVAEEITALRDESNQRVAGSYVNGRESKTAALGRYFKEITTILSSLTQIHIQVEGVPEEEDEFMITIPKRDGKPAQITANFRNFSIRTKGHEPMVEKALRSAGGYYSGGTPITNESGLLSVLQKCVVATAHASPEKK